MRIHTDTLTYMHIVEAARAARVWLIKCEEHGSRKRDHAFEIALSGSSPYRSLADREEQAATWDEWGMFLNELFHRDESLTTQEYRDFDVFRYITDGRFSTLEPSEQHRLHRWEYSNLRRQCQCKCGARRNFR